MKQNVLGNTGIEVTELCFGALPMGPLQKNQPADFNARLTAEAINSGINFIDTAQMYQTYTPVREAMKLTGKRPVIASKSTAADFDAMQEAIDEALEKLEIDYIDIFHMHAARAAPDIFQQRSEALKCLKENKLAGKVRAIGISCHSPKVVSAAAEREDIDVVFALISLGGIGIINGTREDMERAIEQCSDAGKGVYLMKVLGGGNYVDNYADCLEYARSLKGYHSISIGMVSMEEIDCNVRYFSGQRENLPKLQGFSKRFQVVRIVCTACGKCIETCPNEAISMRDGKADISSDKCLQCGYCVSACPQFAIRKV
ncbi:General stress protein 69 [Sedimentisphaera cyanobacteriorum]|uniref:General stress protein 69 n=1 Tax=Sedimentisphaera cyanobacteriorum TaxID=1940790 RepID=A0A1Q2HQ42_9BACT|nr:aldo/keto reductase [Sedimentisphaera cyanobacteriorum]AQQ09363.1 General stress protein 69 [Sedimentisphaera cyanobacteriorum]